MVATEAEAGTVSKRAVYILLECMLLKKQIQFKFLISNFEKHCVQEKSPLPSWTTSSVKVTSLGRSAFQN